MTIANPIYRAALLAILLLASVAPPTARAADPGPPRAKAGEEVFYHVFERSFRDSDGDRIGDLRGLTEGLDYVRDLGVTSILLTPLQPSPFYHNYFATDFESIEPEYGSMADYRAFVRAAHARGLKVYLDMEIQYVAEGHPWWHDGIGKPNVGHADFVLWRDAAHTVAEPFLDRATWEVYDGRRHGIAMLNLDAPAVRRYFERVLLSWADPHGDGSGRDGADGFRIDHMMDDLDNKGVATRLFAEFWTPLVRALKRRRPEFRILAEQSDWGYGQDWLTRGNADLAFAFPLRGAIDALDKRAIVDTLRATAAATPAGKGQIVFVENHDTDRLMSQLDNDAARARAAAAIALLVKGEPLIYYGQELGMRGNVRKGVMTDAAHIPVREAFRWQADLDAPGSAIWYASDRAEWTQRYNRSHDGVSVEEQRDRADSLLAWYRRLLALRRDRTELRGGDQRILCDDGSAMLCLLRKRGERRTLLLVNLGSETARPSADAATLPGAWNDLLEGGTVDLAAVALPPMTVRVLGTP
jgi:alpha-amylase